MIKRVLCLILAAVMLMALAACNKDTNEKEKGNILDMTGPEPGDIYAEFKVLGYEQKIVFKLFPDEAPNAVEEFTTRVERGFYNGRNIHRVIPNFIIQGGSVNFDGTEGNVEFGELFGVEASVHARNFYGALALVADEGMFNYCQFYIVTNKNPVDINAQIEEIEELLKGDNLVRELTEEAKQRLQLNLEVMRSIPENIREQYLTRGGAPHLDGSVSVFGQLVSGGDVIDAIASVAVAAGNPADDEHGISSKPIEEIIIESITIIRIPPEVDEAEVTTSARRQSTTPTTSESPAPPPTEEDDD